ncbi:putative histone-lysine N-methyltransferase eggless [Penaeus vannamei]|uniref:Putative histone-lysine N-methyltransferase eggless n=1 Tax=Penaeus vannamei TaxID=6689 RepID=A0A423SB52_PENVA|nr:putative histone-lysine N-methyltransferase eggless [Penaeus vannamei]
MSRAGTPPREVQQRIEQESKGFTKKHTLHEKTIKFMRHICSNKCLGPKGDNMTDHKGLSPLLYPMMFGWYRHIVKQRRRTMGRNEVYYVAPCGRRLRSVEEVFRYLLDTESNLEIDCFSFELAVDTSHEWEPFKKIVNIDDVSLGEENVQISCVNSLDETAPQTLVYSNVRLPTEHVPLNLDPEFLVCCDCIDDCQDKSKCPCWQLTIQGTRILDRSENPNTGYHYRRLSEQVQSGIYECNSRCKCSNMCLNRVVQHPLRLKLQLFKTARRGWGVRTLHDIPRGGFICVYVGKMLNETIANEEGKMIVGGDDYYAELDYIEVMENAKEGYEEEVENIEEENSKLSVEGSAIAGSDSTDSDGFYSENEVDDTKDDRDFSHPTYMKKVGLTKREKSARLQERSSRNNFLKKGKDEKQRRPQTFAPSQLLATPPKQRANKSVREYFGKDEAVYIMDAKHTGNIGRFLNHSCEPNVFVQNVFVDTHDLRFPWVAFFAISNIRAGTELTWDYSYEVGSVPGKTKYCYCGARKCRGRLL